MLTVGWLTKAGLSLIACLNVTMFPYEPECLLVILYSRMGSDRQTCISAGPCLPHILLGQADQPGRALLIAMAKA